MKATNCNKQLDPLWVCMIVYLLLILLLTASCNPVKQVLRDKSKLDQVASVVVASGYCANDTTIVYSASDTIVKTDTLITIERQTMTVNDTVYFWDNHYITVKKTLTVRDTIQKVVVDQALANQLKTKSAIKDSEINRLKEKSKKQWYYIIALFLILSFAIYSKLKR
jgi:hypothetical protein